MLLGNRKEEKIHLQYFDVFIGTIRLHWLFTRKSMYNQTYAAVQGHVLFKVNCSWCLVGRFLGAGVERKSSFSVCGSVEEETKFWGRRWQGSLWKCRTGVGAGGGEEVLGQDTGPEPST